MFVAAGSPFLAISSDSATLMASVSLMGLPSSLPSNSRIWIILLRNGSSGSILIPGS